MIVSLPSVRKSDQHRVTLNCESYGDDMISWAVSESGEHVGDVQIDARRMRGNDLRDRLTAAVARLPYLVLP